MVLRHGALSYKRWQEEPNSSAGRRKSSTVEELQKLGAALVDLPPAQLDALALPDALLKAVLEAQRITSHEARRRQVQYIGKVMRKVDPEPVRAALAAVDGQSAAARAQPEAPGSNGASA